MSADIGVAASKTEDLQKELERIAAIARGDIPGIVSVQYTEEAIRALESNKTKAEQAARKKNKNTGAVSMAAYTAAAVRDAKYACRGRKFLRIAALNGKTRGVIGRSLAVLQSEKSIEQ